MEEQISKWIAEWSKETARPYQHTNAGWDESEVCAFVAWLVKTVRLVEFEGYK